MDEQILMKLNTGLVYNLRNLVHDGREFQAEDYQGR